MKKIYLVDTENVHSVWIRLLSVLNSTDEMVLFYTNNSQGLSYSDLDALKEGNYNFRMIKCFTGRNGLDFQLSSYLGYLIKEDSESEYCIIANDNGYDALVRFWNKNGVKVKRINVEQIKKLSVDDKTFDEKSSDKLLTAETTVTLEVPSEPKSMSQPEVEVIQELDPVTTIVETQAPITATAATEADKKEEQHTTKKRGRKPLPKNANQNDAVAKEDPEKETQKAPIQYKVMNPLWGELQASKKEASKKETLIKEAPEKEAAQPANPKEEAAKPEPKKRGRKPKTEKDVIATAQEAPKKRGRKPKAEKDVPAVTTKDVVKKEAPKKETSKKETPKKEASKKEAPKTEILKKETSKKETPLKDAPKKEASKKEAVKKAPIRNKSKALSIIKDATKECSFKVSPKDHTTILEILAYDCPEHDLRTINNRLVKAFEQAHGSELYKNLKQAKAITEIYRLID